MSSINIILFDLFHRRLWVNVCDTSLMLKDSTGSCRIIAHANTSIVCHSRGCGNSGTRRWNSDGTVAITHLDLILLRLFYVSFVFVIVGVFWYIMRTTIGTSYLLL